MQRPTVRREGPAMSRGPLLLALAPILLGLAAALPASYQCDSSNGVVCASNLAPGGLAPADTPQFVVLSHDDAITTSSNTAIRAVVNQFSNANGCNVPFTFFVSGGAGSNCNIVRRLLRDNHEIATHTLAHAQLVPVAINITEQIAAQRAFLNTTCGIPLEKMVGFRAPYLLHNPESRAALQALGLRYDSSRRGHLNAAVTADPVPSRPPAAAPPHPPAVIESWPSLTSTSSASRLWPYSMAAGIPQSCQWMAPSTCSTSERYNLFEVPMLQFETSAGTALSSMDPTADSADALLNQIMQQLTFSYNGNRAPLGIYLHTPWFNAKPFHGAALTSFIRKALTMPNVWFVTYDTLIRWMESPVPASRMASWLQCAPVNFAAEQRPACSTYQVKEGDSLFSICAEQEVELLDLLAANPALSSNAAIFVGQRLRLPPWNDTCPADGLSGQPPCRNHTVASGDYLYAVAMSYNLTVDDIVAVNSGLTKTSTLSLGQVLRIPPWPTVECFWGNWSLPSTTPATSPDTAPGPSPAPDASPALITCGSELVELELTLTGFDASTFEAHLPQFTAGMGALVRVPAACISISRAADVGISAAGQRRLLAQRSLLADAQLLTVIAIHTSNATETLEYLQGAQKLGSLNMMMGLLGGQVDKVVATAVDAQGLPIGTSPAPSSPSPSPSPTTMPSPTTSAQPSQTTAATARASEASTSGSSSNVGAIVGAVVGGVGGTLLVAGLAWFIIKKRRAAAGREGGLPGAVRAGWHNPTYAGATVAHISTSGGPGAAPPKAAFELTEVVEATGTPRSARRRNATPFNTAG